MDYEMKYEMTNRLKALRAMNQLMIMMNDEYAYDEWICVVPDGATEDDLCDIAWDDESYQSVERLFFYLCKEYGQAGLWVGV